MTAYTRYTAVSGCVADEDARLLMDIETAVKRAAQMLRDATYAGGLDRHAAFAEVDDLIEAIDAATAVEADRRAA